MATYNKKLESLTLEEINGISLLYLKGYHNLNDYGFRLRGLNRKRRENGLENLTLEKSIEYRIEYIKENYDYDFIYNTIENYLSNNLVSVDRYSGIYLFDCRFGEDYATIFGALLGESVYKKLSEDTRINKVTKTCNDLYDGMGLGSETIRKKQLATLKNKYNVENPMHIESVKESVISPFLNNEYSQKALTTVATNRRKNKKFSKKEFIVYSKLISKYSKEDVIFEYGRNPYDERYPFSCDFYIKSLDLFIELNAHYSHGGHWFDFNNSDDIILLEKLQNSSKKGYKNYLKTWTVYDVNRRNFAKNSSLNYLVFWKNDLSDFINWFINYNCDYESFISDYPKNTY